jgi:protein-S-isoprenylcysteine O-methyltransferase Ste14
MKERPKIYPPVYFLTATVMAVAVHFIFPIRVIFHPPTTYFGAVFIIGGLFMGIWSAYAFKKAGTSFRHTRKLTTSLVTTGFYRLTRNPIYLGMALILLGVAFLLGSIGAMMPIPLFAWVMEAQYIRPEEQLLEEIFGDDYLTYKHQVGRWIYWL